MSSPPLYDAHNHLHDAWLAPHRARVFEDLGRLPLRAAVVNGTCESDWPDVIALCAAGPAPNSGVSALSLLPSLGLHPWHAGNASAGWRDNLQRTLDAHAQTPATGYAPVSIGEIGLDRWILDRARPGDPRLAGLRRAPLEEQREAFVWQLALAAERNLPVTIHCLEAWGALAEVLRSSRLPARGFLLHAYGGSAELAREFAALGAYFSFNGHFLAERHAARREVFKLLPAARLLVETDAPAMPLPADRRAYSLPGDADGGIINHPANLGVAYTALAALREIGLDSLARQIATNFQTLFGAGEPPASQALQRI